MKISDIRNLSVENLISSDCYYAIIIRSPAACGTIMSIEFPHMPRDYRFITYDDIPGNSTIIIGTSKIPILADRTVWYEGQPIAILTGPDRAKLIAFANNVKLTIEPKLPEMEFKTFSHRQLLAKDIVVQGNPDIAFLQSALQTEQSLYLTPAYSFHPDTYAAYCTYNYDKMDIYITSQWPALIHKTICEMLKIKPENLVIKKLYSAPSFSSKIWYPAIVACHTALATFYSKHPVAMIYSRNEDFLYSPAHYPQSLISMKAGMDEQGSLQVIDAVFCADFGWQAPSSATILNQFNAIIKDIYNIPHVRIQSFGVQTNTPPHDSFTALGTSQAIIALEKTMDTCASLLRMDPIQFRKKNISTAKKGYNTSLIAIFNEITEKIILLSDFNRKYASCKLVKARQTTGFYTSNQRSIGFAFGCQNQLSYFHQLDVVRHSIIVTLEKNLDLTILLSYVPDNPESLEIFKSTAAEIMGLSKSAIKIAEKDAHGKIENFITSSGSTVLLINDLIKKACIDIQKKRFRETLPISITKLYKQQKENKNSNISQKTWGAAVVELECSGISLQPSITGIWLVVNAGKILNKEKARNSLLLDIETVVSKLYLPLQADQQYYSVKQPVTKNIPITIDFIESSAEPKNIGELAYGLIPAAALNALQLITDTPITNDSFIDYRESMLKTNLNDVFSFSVEKDITPKDDQ